MARVRQTYKRKRIPDLESWVDHVVNTDDITIVKKMVYEMYEMHNKNTQVFAEYIFGDVFLWDNFTGDMIKTVLDLIGTRNRDVEYFLFAMDYTNHDLYEYGVEKYINDNGKIAFRTY